MSQASLWTNKGFVSRFITAPHLSNTRGRHLLWCIATLSTVSERRASKLCQYVKRIHLDFQVSKIAPSWGLTSQSQNWKSCLSVCTHPMAIYSKCGRINLIGKNCKMFVQSSLQFLLKTSLHTALYWHKPKKLRSQASLSTSGLISYEFVQPTNPFSYKHSFFHAKIIIIFIPLKTST